MTRKSQEELEEKLNRLLLDVAAMEVQLARLVNIEALIKKLQPGSGR
jgi:hypothetical protein